MRYGIIMNESDHLLQLLTVCAIDSVRHGIWHAISAGRPHWAVLRCSKPNAPGSCASHRRSQLGGLSRRVLAWHLLRAFGFSFLHLGICCHAARRSCSVAMEQTCRAPTEMWKQTRRGEPRGVVCWRNIPAAWTTLVLVTRPAA